MLRSNVLSINRLVHPGFDLSLKESITEFTHEYGAEEPTTFHLKVTGPKIRYKIL